MWLFMLVLLVITLVGWLTNRIGGKMKTADIWTKLLIVIAVVVLLYLFLFIIRLAILLLPLIIVIAVGYWLYKKLSKGAK